MEKILVSACLLGARVRYNGRDMYCDDPLLQKWFAEGRLVACCPEIMAGFPIPRQSHEIIGEGGGLAVLDGKAKVFIFDGTDHTESFIEAAQATLKIAKREKLKLAVLKNNSPSCGGARIYNGRFDGTVIEGLGVTAALLQKNGLKIFTEETIEAAAKELEKLERNK